MYYTPITDGPYKFVFKAKVSSLYGRMYNKGLKKVNKFGRYKNAYKGGYVYRKESYGI